MISIKKFYFNEKGSVLFIVIMVTATLLLLGTTASVISLSSYKMSKVESLSKKNFHIAEAISEEAELKLDEYIKRYLYNSYEKTSEYIKENEGKSIKEKNEIFKEIFKDQILTLKKNLENTTDYNLKTLEKYDISVDVILEDLQKQKDIEEFDISIISLFEEQHIPEMIKIKYKIKLPKYNDFKQNLNLIEKEQWSNYKW